MLDLSFIRQNADLVTEAMRRRGIESPVDEIIAVDRQRRDHLTEIEALKRTRNEDSKKIGEIMRSGGNADELRQEMKDLGARITTLDSELEQSEARLRELMVGMPNPTHESVPEGKSDADNRIERSWGEPPVFDFEPEAHYDIGTRLGILDFERSAKIAGARFAVYFGAGARLERALIQFMLDLHTVEHGYTEVMTPFLVNAEALFGTSQLPKFAEDLFKIEANDLYLIPTAEVPVTNLHAGEILDPGTLPILYCAYTPCFRSEAGSYGKDVRGLFRQHQFNKVELVRVCEPEHSYEALEALTGHAETVLKRLGLPYRVATLCTGDTGFGSAKTYDLEVWLPSQQAYREISSCSNFEDFQARRAKIRYRPAVGEKPRLAHTLNGSGLAVGRTVIAILENYQQADGSVVIPEALRPYMGGVERISSS